MREPVLLGELAERDIHLWAVGDRLQVDAPAGALTPELRARLVESKADILAYLREPAPASFAQQRLWVLDQIEPGAATYVIPAALRLRGPLDVPALEGALNALIERHESLRTTFAEIDGRAVQIVAEPAATKLPVVNLAGRVAELDARLSDEAARGFDLKTGPLFRATLYRLSPDEHVLSLAQHHIVSDAWSLSVLQSELGALYRERAGGQATSLPPMSIQYRDFARWQHHSLTGPALARREEYWRSHIAGAPQMLDLPTDRVRPPVESHRGSVYSFDLPRELSEQVGALSRREGATLFMVLLAAFEVLLWRYSGQEELLVGTAVANRHREEQENLVGLFVNTLVLRGDLSGNPSARQLISRVKEACLGAYANEDMPFEKLVEALKPERELSRNPIFQVMLVLQNAPLEPFVASGLEAAPITVDRGASQLDLALSVLETPNGLRGTFEFATDLFEHESIVRMSGHLGALLQGMVADPNRPISDLPLITPTERARLREWNATDVQMSDVCVQDLISRVAAKSPDRVAVEFGGRLLTYRELEQRSNRIAERLRRRGVGPGARVGVYVERSFEMVIGLLGVLKAGGAYVPLDPMFPSDRLAFMVEDAGTTVLLTTTSMEPSLPTRSVASMLVDVDDDGVVHPSMASTARASLSDAAYVIYTSGSTGRPKGVAVPHGALVNLLESMAREPGFTADDVLLSVTTLSFDIAGLELYLPLIRGGRVAIATREEALDADALLARIKATGTTVMQATPATWRMLIDSGWKGTPHLKVLCGGEALPRDLAEAMVTRVRELWNVYGPTETTIWSTAGLVASGSGSVSIGRPIANTQTWVLDSNREPLPIGVPGELYIGGQGLAIGYWNRDQLTSEKFVADPFSNEPAARMYRTGDRARWLSNGTLECLGRIDDQVKVRGYRIELGEIESVIGDFESVSAAVVVAQDTPGGDRRLVGFVVCAPDHTLDRSRLREHLEQRLPAYMVPSAWKVLDALPLTPNGKVNRRALGEMKVTDVDATSQVAPRTNTEQALAKIWADVLGLSSVGIDENFFSSGGNSLSAVRLMARTRAHFNIDAGLRTLFERPTIAALAEAIDRVDAVLSGPRSIIPIKADGSRPPVFAVPGHNGDVFCYVAFARYISADQPIFGVQPRGLEGTEPFRNIPDLASYCVEQIRQFRPAGPYMILGFCAGGSVAFEIARQLREAGEEVSMLALLGSPSPATYRWSWTALRAVKYYSARVVHHARETLSRPFSETVAYISSKLRKQDAVVGDSVTVAPSLATQRLEKATLGAIRAFRPTKFPGTIDLVLPSEAWRSSGPQPWRWARLSKQLNQHARPVPCTLDEMLLEPHVRLTAAIVDRRLDEITSQVGAIEHDVDSRTPVMAR